MGRQSAETNHLFCDFYVMFLYRTEVYLSSIEDQVEIMQSLQLPKKITLRGSDGKLYIVMCKPKVGIFIMLDMLFSAPPQI